MTTHSQRTTRRLLAATAGLVLVTSAATATTAQTHSHVLAAASLGSVAAEQALARRWAEMFALLLEEFKADGRNPTGILQGDFSTREIRILTSSGAEGSGAGITFTDADLAQSDLRKAAASLYRVWRVIEDSGIGR